MTLRTTTETEIFQIDYDQFCAITCLDPDVTGVAEMRNRHDIVNGLSIFSQLSEPQRNRLVGFFSHYYFPINHLLIQQGEQADSFWVLLEGGQATIQALDENGTKLTSTVSHGQTYFCETALLGEVPQESSVEAVAGSQWLRLHWTDFQQFDDEEPLEIREILEIDTEKLQEMESQAEAAEAHLASAGRAAHPPQPAPLDRLFAKGDSGHCLCCRPGRTGMDR